MARPLRIEYPGAVYHVINRGNQRQRVFHNKRYYELFVEKMIKFSKVFDVGIRSYCLMPNHFHLYLQTEHANLGRFMQSFLTSYCVVANRFRKSSGHIFQGRFKAHLVQDELYGSRVSRYIHLNPVRIKNLSNSDAGERLIKLHQFPWSSFRALAGLASVPDWLDTEATWCRWGSSVSEQSRNYREYVEEGLGITLESPFAEVIAQSVLGDDEFVNEVARDHLFNRKADEREEPSLRQLQGALLPSRVTKAVAAAFGIDVINLTAARSKHRLARRIAIYSVSRYCRSCMPQTELAAHFGIKLGGFGISRRKAESEIEKSSELQRTIASIDHSLGCA